MKDMFVRAFAGTLSALATAVALLAVPQAQAEVVLQVNGGGILTGATGVKVGDASYDVAFRDGTCVALFQGCDALSDFAFGGNQALAAAASAALMSQVFLGAYEAPDKILGCTNAEFCYVHTPWGFHPTNALLLWTTLAYNAAADAADAVHWDGQSHARVDYTPYPTAVYAVWSLAAVQEPPANPVPEPGSLALLGAGLAGWLLSRRR